MIFLVGLFAANAYAPAFSEEKIREDFDSKVVEFYQNFNTEKADCENFLTENLANIDFDTFQQSVQELRNAGIFVASNFLNAFGNEELNQFGQDHREEIRNFIQNSKNDIKIFLTEKFKEIETNCRHNFAKIFNIGAPSDQLLADSYFDSTEMKLLFDLKNILQFLREKGNRIWISDEDLTRRKRVQRYYDHGGPESAVYYLDILKQYPQIVHSLNLRWFFEVGQIIVNLYKKSPIDFPLIIEPLKQTCFDLPWDYFTMVTTIQTLISNLPYQIITDGFKYSLEKFLAFLNDYEFINWLRNQVPDAEKIVFDVSDFDVCLGDNDTVSKLRLIMDGYLDCKLDKKVLESGKLMKKIRKAWKKARSEDLCINRWDRNVSFFTEIGSGQRRIESWNNFEVFKYFIFWSKLGCVFFDDQKFYFVQDLYEFFNEFNRQFFASEELFKDVLDENVLSYEMKRHREMKATFSRSCYMTGDLTPLPNYIQNGHFLNPCKAYVAARKSVFLNNMIFGSEYNFDTVNFKYNSIFYILYGLECEAVNNDLDVNMVFDYFASADEETVDFLYEKFRDFEIEYTNNENHENLAEKERFGFDNLVENLVENAEQIVERAFYEFEHAQKSSSESSDSEYMQERVEETEDEYDSEEDEEAGDEPLVN